jgi:hypothetical protein
MYNLLWCINRATFTFANSAHKERWRKTGRKIAFYFDPRDSDDAGITVFRFPDSASVAFELAKHNSIVKKQVLADGAIVSARVCFEVKLETDRDQFIGWLDDRGGGSCARISLLNCVADIIGDAGTGFRFLDEAET